MRSCCVRWQRHMRRLANLEKRLKTPGLRCSWRGCQGDDSLAAELQQHIALYELGLPYREMAK